MDSFPLFAAPVLRMLSPVQRVDMTDSGDALRGWISVRPAARHGRPLLWFMSSGLGPSRPLDSCCIVLQPRRDAVEMVWSQADRGARGQQQDVDAANCEAAADGCRSCGWA